MICKGAREVRGDVWAPRGRRQVAGRFWSWGRAWCRQCGPPACGPSDSFPRGLQARSRGRSEGGGHLQSAEATERPQGWGAGPKGPQSPELLRAPPVYTEPFPGCFTNTACFNSQNIPEQGWIAVPPKAQRRAMASPGAHSC